MLENMRNLRKQKGLTMKELGNMVSCAESTISQYENGRIEPPLSVLCAIADALDVSLDLLVRGKEKDRPEERSVKGLLSKYDALTTDQLVMLRDTLQALLAERQFQAHLRQDGAE